MFRRLKEKISEEVKQSSLAQYSPFKDDSSKGTNQDMEPTTSKQDAKNLIDFRDNGASIQHETDENQSFSIGDDDGLCSEPTSPTPTVPLFENVDLSDNPSVSHRRRRTSSVSSSSSLFPAYNPSSVNHNIQSDLESASEVDESAVNLEVVSKEQLFFAFQKAKSRYLKYKTRYGDVVKAYRDQVNENGRVKTILTESQDKALRRISELKEQSQLDQKAKFDLEENFRLVLEEKDEVVRVLQTQVRLLKSGINPVDDNGFASGSSSPLDGDIESKKNDDDTIVHPDPLTRIRLQEDTINKLKNLLKSCKETITKEKESSAQLITENERLVSKLDETESKLKEILESEQSKEKSFDDELKRAAEKIDLFKEKEEENALNLAESKRLMHEEMETREKSLQELKMQLQQLNSEKDSLESNLQEKSKLILELEEMKYDNLDRSKQQLIDTEATLEEEKQNLLQEMSRGKAAALQLLQQETEKRILDIQKEKSDSDLGWNEKLEALKAECDEKIVSERVTSEKSLSEAIESREKSLNENQKLKEVLERNEEQLRCVMKRITEFRAANNELCLDLAIINENQVAEFKELRQELLARIGNVWSLEAKELERVKAELIRREERIGELEIDLESRNREVTTLKQLRETTESEIEALRKQKASLCENNAEFQRVIEELSDTKQSLEERLDVATNLVSELKSIEAELMKQLESFREQNASAEEELSKLRESYEVLRTECEALRAEKSISDAEIANIVTLRAELESKDDDNMAKLRRIEGEASQQLDEVCSENERVCSELRHSLEAEQSKVAELNAVLAATKQDNEAQLLEVNQRLALELDNMRNATESLKCEVDATREQLIASRSEYAEHISHLSDQINTKEAQLKELLGGNAASQFEKMKLESLGVFRERLQDVRRQLNDDRSAVEVNRSECFDVMENLKGVLRAEKERNDKLEQGYEEEMISLKTRHDVAVERLAELELSTEEASNLRQRLEDFETSYGEKQKNYENEILNKADEIGRVVQKLEFSERFAAEIKEELEECRKLLLQKEEEVTMSMETAKELKQQINTLINEKDCLEQELLDTKTVFKDVEELKQQLDTLRNEKGSLEQELLDVKELSKGVAELKHQVEALRTEKESLERELFDAREVSKGAEELKQELEECRKLLSQKEEEVAIGMETTEELRQQVDTLKTEKESLEQELFDTREVSKGVEELKRELDTFRMLLLQKEEELMSIVETAKELKQQVDTLKTEKESLEKELLDMREVSKRAEELKQQLDTLRSEKETLKQEHLEIQEVSKGAEKLKQEMETFRMLLLQKEEELTSITEATKDLKQQVDTLKTKKESLQQELLDAKEVSKGVFEELETYQNDTKALKQQINLLKAENERLESELIASKNTTDESSLIIVQLRKSYEDREAQYEGDRRAEMENVKKLHKEKLNDLNQKFKTKIKNVAGKNAERVTAVETKLAELREEKKQLEGKVEQLEATVMSTEQLKQDYEREKSEREELSEKVSDLSESLAVVSATSLEKDSVVTSLEQRLEELHSVLRSKEKKVEESIWKLREHEDEMEETVTRINEANQEKLNDLKKRAENKLAQIKKQMQIEIETIRHQNIEEAKSYEVKLSELREEKNTETERIASRCRELESEKENLSIELHQKNSQIDESLITAQVNHMESTKMLRALESELSESMNRNEVSKAVVEDLRHQLSIFEQEKSILAKQLEELRGGREDDGSELREGLQREYDEMLRIVVDDHAAKIKQLTKEFSEMIAKKEEEGREALANAVEQSLNDDNRLRRDHAKQIESIGREISERETNLKAELELRDRTIKDLESELESNVRNYEDKLSTFQTEQRQQIDAIEKKWKALMRRELDEKEEAYREEIEGLSDEWKMERKFAVNSKSVELNSQELQKQTKLATSVVESGGYSNELLRRQVMTMQSQLQILKDRNRDEVEQLKETLRSRNCPIPHFDESRYTSSVLDQRLESLETEYLKNILFEYMMGRETLTLAKVIAAVVRFSEEQTSKVLEREEARSSGVSGQAQKRENGDSNGSKPTESVSGYADIIKDNAKFVKFYQAQKIVPEGQWDDFMASLRQSLPSTFRITGYKSQAKALLRIIESEYFAKLAGLTIEGEQLEDPFPLPWYPDKLGWQLNLSRKAIRKTEALERLHNFLISETESGNISRQEAVSMIPPLLLDVRPEHKVLDMCAAPGSKTAQLIEMLHVDDKTVPEGVLVANDIDNKRCYMLVHQAKRLQSSCLLITNHDSGAMPNISLSDGKQLKFDRILCDVPCSGDGTLRKNIDIWVKWNIANCLNFHGIQSRILKRGLELLAVGGRLVYSTCSLCPLEDESVIHHILSRCNGSVELVNVNEKLPGLKYVPGLSDWKVMNRDLEEFRSYEDVPDKFRSQIKDHMFPPKEEDAVKYNLHRCLRILPHLQNTGGFFVAVLQKVGPLPWETKLNGDETSEQLENGSSRSNSSDANDPKRNPDSEPARKKQRMSGYREDPFIYFKPDDTLYPGIRDAYNIDETFDSSLLLTRCIKGKRKTIYFTSKTVKEIVTSNEDKIKIINTGLRLFTRCDTKKSSPTEFRVTQEGLLTILPYLKERVVKVTKNDAILLLSSTFPVLNQLNEATLEQLKKYVNGSLVLVLEEEVESCPDKLLIPLCAWKGISTLRAYVPKSDKLHYLRLCGVDTSEFERKKFQTTGETSKEEENAEAEEPNVNNDEGSCLVEEEELKSMIGK